MPSRFLYRIILSSSLLVGLAFAEFIMGVAAADEPQRPPKDALVLFDGKDLSQWVMYTKDPKKLSPAMTWTVKNGYMEVGKGDIMTKEKFGPDFQLHVEFWLPLMADKKGQARANSGVYLQGRYEVQVLDSFKNETYANGACGALYGLIAPSKNASKPPEQWQTYDIEFHAPRIDDKDPKGTKILRKGQITVVQNGETIIDKGEFDKVTGGAMDNKIGTRGPIRLQDHGCPVRYKNIWIKPLLLP